MTPMMMIADDTSHHQRVIRQIEFAHRVQLWPGASHALAPIALERIACICPTHRHIAACEFRISISAAVLYIFSIVFGRLWCSVSILRSCRMQKSSNYPFASSCFFFRLRFLATDYNRCGLS